MQLTQDVTKRANIQIRKKICADFLRPSLVFHSFFLFLFVFFVSFPFSSRFSNALRVVLIVSSNSRYGEGWSRFIDHRAKTGHAPQMETYAVNPLLAYFCAHVIIIQWLREIKAWIINLRAAWNTWHSSFFSSYIKRG